VSVYGGVHVGLSSLYAVALKADGRALIHTGGRFKEPAMMADVLEEVVAEVRSSVGADPIWTLALEKPQRMLLAPRQVELAGAKFRPQIVKPALSAVLLGAIPSGPGLLISLGREVRLATIDSTHTFKEYRVMEGGGAWWQQEFPRLAAHSRRLSVHLKDFPQGVPPLSRLVGLLELGRPPSPDAVLQARLEKIAAGVVGMASKLLRRLPGIQRFHISGFLAGSALGQLVAEKLVEHARPSGAEFPPEVGAALSSFAMDRENWERSHLGKEPFGQDPGKNEWAPPRELVRRLYRTRKPFEHYGE